MKPYLLSALVAFALSLVFCAILIPVLRRLKAGQNILVYVKEHKNKSGTPTMGGIAFVLSTLLTSVIFIHKAERTVILTHVIGLAYMTVGLLDDFLKLRHKENLGLKAWQKFVFQACIAVLAGVYCYRARLTGLYLPLFGGIWSVGAWIIPFSAFAFIATVNAVNLTDGLDGLASAVSIPFFAFCGIMILLENGSVGLSTICFCLVGSLLAYLVFNSSSASVFMGDTGSLALGGFASSICVFSGNMLYIPIIGLMFVISVISVLIQVIYYKVTGGKRVFLMAPLHHHFQEKGYSESKIAYGYFIITLVLGVLTILSLL